MDKSKRAEIIRRAEKLELETKQKGRKNGALGATGLALLRLLLFKYGDQPHPSYKILQRDSGLAVDTIAKALKRLEEARLITITRRKIRTRQGNRVITNLYSFPGVAPLIPPLGSQRNPILNLLPYLALSARSEPGPFRSWDEWDGPLKDALASLGKAVAARDAEQDCS